MEQSNDTPPAPVSISRDEKDSIVIAWSDQSTTTYTATELRKRWPCANCREKKRGEAPEEGETPKPIGLPILSAAEARPLRVEGMKPVGTYAYQISFSDGHSSGSYPFRMLHDLAESEESST